MAMNKSLSKTRLIESVTEISLLVILILAPILASGQLWAATPDLADIPVETLERLGLFHSVLEWPEDAPATICGLSQGGFALLTEAQQLWTVRWNESQFDRGESQSVPLKGKPSCMLEWDKGIFVIGSDLGELVLWDARESKVLRRWDGWGSPWEPVALSQYEDPITAGNKKETSVSRLLVADRIQGRVLKLDIDSGVLLHSWNGFIDPTAISVFEDQIRVSDRGWHRVISCMPGEDQGRFDQGLGDHGAAPGLFAGPWGLEIISRNWMLVSDRDNHRIQVLGRHGMAMHHWGLHSLIPRESNGRLHYPEEIVFDRDNMHVAVLEPSERRVQVFSVRDPEMAADPAESWQRVDLVSHFGESWAIDHGDESFLLVVVEPDSERISILDHRQQSPTEIDDVGGHGTKVTRFRTPSGVDFMHRSGYPRFVVSDRGNRRLQMFEVRRPPSALVVREPWITAFIRSVDLSQLAAMSPGWSSDVDPIPGAVACLKDGQIAVVDQGQPRILLLNDQFRALGLLGETAGLKKISAISEDGNGLLVADSSAQKIVRLGLDGSVKVIHSGSVDGVSVQPAGVARHADGSICWTDSKGHRLLKTNEDSGETLVILGDTVGENRMKTGERDLYRPAALRITKDGKVWILDQGNHRGVVLDKEGVLKHFGSATYLPNAKIGTPTKGES